MQEQRITYKVIQTKTEEKKTQDGKYIKVKNAGDPSTIH